ncbi:hypothetical protein HYU90_03015 [Candidatus Collierbacteria bacterium]|nr:hypothetical protein [Candidatus Collierbacteria bacterium]
MKTKINGKKYSSADSVLIQMLLSVKCFRKQIKEVRERCEIKEFAKTYKTPEIYSMVMEEAKSICLGYDLPRSWEHSIAFYIISDEFEGPGDGIGVSGPTLKLKNDILDKRPEPLTIKIYQRISFSKLTKLIEKYKDPIKNYLSKLPTERQLPKSRLKLRCKIFDLYSSGKRPRDIAKELHLDYDEVNLMILRFKRSLGGEPINKKISRTRTKCV